MAKQYLTPELIRWIEKEAADPIWKMGVLAGMGGNWYSVLTVSSLDLIHIKGNRDTGWAHVISRHGYYSNDLYFGNGALGSPSRFQSYSIPIFDWVHIADDIFALGKIDDREHPDSAMFVKYSGESPRYTRSDGKKKDFILILYRGTQIVHSIFPKKNLQPDTPNSKLKKLKRALDFISAEKSLAGNWLTIRIPYVNSEITERYVIVVHIDLNNSHGKAHLQVNWLNGQPRYSIHTLLDFDLLLEKEDVKANNIEFTRFINTFTKYGDFAHIEEVMIRTEKNLFPDA